MLKVGVVEEEDVLWVDMEVGVGVWVGGGGGGGNWSRQGRSSCLGGGTGNGTWGRLKCRAGGLGLGLGLVAEGGCRSFLLTFTRLRTFTLMRTRFAMACGAALQALGHRCCKFGVAILEIESKSKQQTTWYLPRSSLILNAWSRLDTGSVQSIVSNKLSLIYI